MVEHHTQEFLHSIISIYYPDNDADLRKNEGTRESLEDGSSLPGRSRFDGAFGDPHIQEQG